jgi:hypothetical protein
MARLKTAVVKFLTYATTAGAMGGYVTYGCSGSSGGGGDSGLTQAVLLLSLMDRFKV